MKNQLLIFFLMASIFGFSQKKILKTTFTSTNITIDGKLDESIWETTPVADNFIMFEPDNGKPIPENKKRLLK